MTNKKPGTLYAPTFKGKVFIRSHANGRFTVSTSKRVLFEGPDATACVQWCQDNGYHTNRKKAETEEVKS